MRSNRTAEAAGVWVAIDGHTSWLVRRANCPKFKALAARLRKPHQRMLDAVDRAERAGTATPEEIEVRDRVVREITAEAAGRTLLVGWEGMKDGSDALAFSPEAAVALLKDSDYAMNLLEELAGSETTFRQMEREEAAGKPGRTSGGSSKAEAQ